MLRGVRRHSAHCTGSASSAAQAAARPVPPDGGAAGGEVHVTARPETAVACCWAEAAGGERARSGERARGGTVVLVMRSRTMANWPSLSGTRPVAGVAYCVACSTSCTGAAPPMRSTWCRSCLAKCAFIKQFVRMPRIHIQYLARVKLS